MKEEQTEQLTEYKRFNKVTSKKVTSNKIEIHLSESVIPKFEPDDRKFIHGDIFEHAVQQAYGYTSEKNDPWIRFTELYPSMEKEKKEQYKTFMDKAGQVAWDIFYTNVKTVYGSKKNSIPSFEHTIQNNTLSILTSKLEADIFVSSLPNIVCEIKYSTMDKDLYEREYLVNAIVQVLIYSLALKLDSSTLHLQILVCYSRIGKVVLYESDVHKDETLVNRLLKKLRVINEVAEESDVRKGKNPKESEKAFTVAKNINLTTPEEEFTDDDNIIQSLDIGDHESTVKKDRSLTESEEESTDDDETTQSLDVVDHGSTVKKGSNLTESEEQSTDDETLPARVEKLDVTREGGET